ncbi:hypothetical protein LOK49_LG13G00504 [Camellia lanceoleosa]|uniref:Uncharacterized protein n=1 Tax=Camellia lanceoleosa TaxID=1840588 RepID=A0ACC0FMU5_9ERIC|nr:hypothetical protein LOK49_LG13G00504 [Camellia lanceoleosa]
MRFLLGNIIEAKLIVEENLDLPNIWNNDGSLPLHLAAMHGQRKMTLFLLSVTRDDEESKPYEGEVGATLMRFAINVGFYDTALDLLGATLNLAWKDFSSRSDGSRAFCFPKRYMLQHLEVLHLYLLVSSPISLSLSFL